MALLNPPGPTLGRVNAIRATTSAFGATHRDLVAHHRGVLFVNPGSATLPARPVAGGTGTVAVLEIRAGVVTADVVRV